MPAGHVAMFSTSQFVSLLIIPVSIAMLLYLSRRTEPGADRSRPAAAPLDHGAMTRRRIEQAMPDASSEELVVEPNMTGFAWTRS